MPIASPTPAPSWPVASHTPGRLRADDRQMVRRRRAKSQVAADQADIAQEREQRDRPPRDHRRGAQVEAAVEADEFTAGPEQDRPAARALDHRRGEQAGLVALDVGHVARLVDLVPDERPERFGDQDVPTPRDDRHRGAHQSARLRAERPGRDDDVRRGDHPATRPHRGQRPARISLRTGQFAVANEQSSPRRPAGRAPRASAAPGRPAGRTRRRRDPVRSAARTRPGRRRRPATPRPRRPADPRRCAPARPATPPMPRRPGRPWPRTRTAARLVRRTPATGPGCAESRSSSGPGSLSDTSRLPSPAELDPAAGPTRSMTHTESPAPARAAAHAAPTTPAPTTTTSAVRGGASAIMHRSGIRPGTDRPGRAGRWRGP